MVEVLISLSPSDRDMRGMFYMDSLGKVVRPFSPWFNVTDPKRFVTFVYLFIIHGFPYLVKRIKKKIPLSGGEYQTTTAGVEDLTYSRSFSGVDHS